jgi:hypothetical protein
LPLSVNRRHPLQIFNISLRQVFIVTSPPPYKFSALIFFSAHNPICKPNIETPLQEIPLAQWHLIFWKRIAILRRALNTFGKLAQKVCRFKKGSLYGE